MDEVLSSVKELSVSDLRDSLTSYGQSVGPITSTTKLLFQKKLAKCIYAEKYGEMPLDAKSTNDDTAVKATVESKSTGNVERDSQGSKSNTSVDGGVSVFYAVSLDSGDKNTAGEYVFTDKAAALAVMKKHPGSRFKVFRNREEALEFTRHFSFSSPVVKTNSSSLETTSTGVTAEKSNFKSLKTQDLTELRKTIERGDKSQFLCMVWNNPRYLVSSGDTPVILHEGLRYNALHVAAHKNKPDMAKTILETLLDPEFTKQLYAGTNDNADTQTRRIDFLVDLYLNTPDKGSGESPLHFASKYGFPDVIEVLLGYPGVDKQLRNKYGETPEEVVCRRCTCSTPELKNRITELLKGLCYVPLLRSEDNTTVPVIGQPWSPDQSTDHTRSQVKKSPKDPNLTIRARAGPMSPSQAKLFYNQWMAPPVDSPLGDKKTVTRIRREDGEKGMERLGRQLAAKMHIPWLEYWEFLDQFVDLSTDEGVKQIEEHFRKQQTSAIFTERVDNFGPLNVSNTSSVFGDMSQRDLHSSFLDSKSRPLIQPSSLTSISNNKQETDPEELDKDSPTRTGDAPDGSQSVCDNNNVCKTDSEKEKEESESQDKSRVWSYRDKSETVDQEHESPVKALQEEATPEKTSGSKCNLDASQITRNYKFGKKEEETKSDPWSYRQGAGSTNTEKSSPARNESFQSPSRLDSEGSTSFDDNVLATFSGLKLSSSDEEFHTPTSQKNSDSESFSTPGKHEVSFNTAMTNLCDDLKLKLIFTPEQAQLTRGGKVVGSPFGKITVSLGNSHHANEAFRLLSTSKMMDDDEDDMSDQPAPVLVGLDPRRAGSDPSCIFANVWVLSESLHTSHVNNIFPDTQILLEDSEMRNQLLNIEGPKLMTVDISCDEKYTTRQRTVPVQALFFQAKMTPMDIFVHGLKPSKTDLDVLRAIHKQVDVNKFPLTHRWLQRVSALATDNKQSWPSPARLRREARQYSNNMSHGRSGSLSPLVSGSPFSPQRSRTMMSSPLIGNWAPRAALFQSSPKGQPFSKPGEKFKQELDLSATVSREERDCPQ